MNPKELRIVFMGTPEFAVPSLRALVAGGYNVVAVVTTPDRPPDGARNCIRARSSWPRSNWDFRYCSPKS